MAYYNSYMQPANYQMPGYNVPSQPVQPVVQQSYAPAPMGSNVIPVDGEVGAKAFMVPSGSTGPIALWDTNDSLIYLRTFNSAGMPNPLKKLRYEEEEPVPMLPSGQSGASPQIDTSQFVTKSDMEDFKRELMNAIRQNGNPQAQNNNNNARRQ